MMRSWAHGGESGGDGVPYVVSDITLGRHYKTTRVAHQLEISLPEVVGHLHYLWWWCIEFCEDGDLSGFTVEDVAEAARWPGDPVEFFNALASCGNPGHYGFIEVQDGRTLIHDWWEYAGRYVEMKTANRNRQRERRLRNSDVPVTGDTPDCDVPVTGDICHSDVPVTDVIQACDDSDTSRVCRGATVPDRTGPDHITCVEMSPGDISTVIHVVEAETTKSTEPLDTESYPAVPVKPKVKRQRPGSDLTGFEEFRAAYPRNIAWTAAERVWPKAMAAIAKLRPDDPVRAMIVAAEGYTADIQARGVAMQFVCHAASWLNQERFRDYLPGSALDLLAKKHAGLEQRADSPASEPETPTTKTLSELEREQAVRDAENPPPVIPNGPFVPRTLRTFRTLTGTQKPPEPESKPILTDPKMAAVLQEAKQVIERRLHQSAPPDSGNADG